ncbi:MAG: family 10 glycosylhydrolase [Ideonella sp. WA131b]|jgi:uncharacterized lipoprotein YddW (UPF0748 family)|nr:family 10 glycosylhydrolase [Ideonella sp. WA131b]
MSAPPSRREALGRLGALGTLATLGPLATGGCAGLDRPSPLIEVPAPAPAPAAAPEPAEEGPPPSPRELRGAWVATVANIDWPSRAGLSGAQQRHEALALLDRARALNLNLLVLQVRPAGDAIYPSALEPWTEFLSGEQGRAPWLAGEPAWDPLAFWLEQAHARAIELHVWFNTYRARHSAAQSPPVAPHLAVRQPALVRRYGEQLWMDPGEPAAAAHTLAVVADVLRRYAVDGVHIDDYFYPYPVLANPAAGPGSAELPFPDDDSHARHRAAGGTLAREDWRRANVDALVRQLHDTVHAVRPGTRFGISPFGIGRPERRPPGITGFSQYDKLFADVERWIAEGWLDYLVPQLYWPIDRVGQQFPVLLAHWQRELAQLSPPPQRHLWPGLFTSQVRRRADDAPGPRAWPAAELLAQVQLLRQQGAAGHVHFSLVALMQDRDGLAAALQRGPYAEPALVPATPWLDARVPAAPTLQREGAALRIEPAAGEPPVARWALWRRVAGRWRFAVLPGTARTVALEGADRVALAAVSRTGVEGPRHLFTP